MRSEFLRHGFLVFGATTSVNFASYLFNSVLSRWLGVAGYGTLASIVAALVVAAIPASVFATVMVKYAAELQAVGDEVRLHTLTLRALAIGATAGAIAIAAVLLLSGAIASYLNIENPRLIAVAAGILGLSLPVTVLRGVLQGRQRFRRFALSVLVEGGLRGALGIGFVALGYGVVGALTGWCTAELIALAFVLWATRTGAGQQGAPVHLDWRRIGQTCAGVGISAASATVLGFADMILVKHFFDAHIAGLYGALSLCGRVLTFGLGFLPTILLPKATARAVSGVRALPVLLQAIGFSAVVSIVAISIAALAPRLPLKLLVGNGYLDAAPLVLPYCIAVTLLTLTGLVTTYKTALHRFDFVLPISAIAVAEIVAIYIWHASIGQVVNVLIASNLSALVAACINFRRSVPLPAFGRRAELTFAVHNKHE